jgi:hypothetical protein
MIQGYATMNYYPPLSKETTPIEQRIDIARQARKEIMRKNGWTGKQYRKHLKVKP